MLQMMCIKDVVRKEKEDGLKLMVGGGMNAHIWQPDKFENNNGILLKGVMDERNLQILNGV